MLLRQGSLVPLSFVHERVCLPRSCCEDIAILRIVVGRRASTFGTSREKAETAVKNSCRVQMRTIKHRLLMISSKPVLAAAIAATASSQAFVVPTLPAQCSSRILARPCNSVMRMSAGADYVATLPGAPFGDGKIFDPLRLAAGAQPEDIKKWREAEIKHGRIAMLATVGVLVAEQFHPLFLVEDDIGPAVYHFQEISARFPQFWVAAGLGMAVIEYTQINIGFEAPDPVTGEGGLREDYIPGDLGFDPLGLKPEDEEGRNVMETKELNHGRLAMIGIAGMLVQELVNAQPIFP